MLNTTTFTLPETTLLRLLGMSLGQSNKDSTELSLTEEEWADVLMLANRHEVLGLISSFLPKDLLSEEQMAGVQCRTAKTIHQSIQLQVLNAKLTALLDRAGITAVTLKGSAIARFYPIPEFRKTTDIDLFVADRDDFEKAVQLLCSNGFLPSGAYHANHHVVLTSEKNEVVELHSAWAEDFQNKALNRCLERLKTESTYHSHLEDCQGFRICVYDTAWQAFYLLIHMLQHFVGSGFGVRNLCDWVVLWEHCEDAETRDMFRKLVWESGTEAFAKAVTSVCVRYLALSKEKSPFPAGESAKSETTVSLETVDALLRDILDAGEFGYAESARMVGMDGSSFGAYLREFHHQMHLNFPRAGKIFLLFPVLWIATLVRFLSNNRKLKRPPVSAILKKAGGRGQLVCRLLPK